jgi:hypothetical protein
MAKSKLARYRRARKKKANPEGLADHKELAVNIGVGFAGYAGTRLLARMAYSQAVKRWPKASEHVHVAASALGAAGVYFGSKHYSKVSDYHEAAAIGAGIALIQTAFQTYLPKFGWIVADVDASQYTAKRKTTLPPADLNSLLPSDSAPELNGAVGTGDGFDLDMLLLENPEVEAIPIGQSEPEQIEVFEGLEGGDDPVLAFSDGDDFSDIANHNGMLN